LAIAAGAVAAFFGFVALTSWTSSGDLSEQDSRDLGTFCYVLSLGDEYQSRLTEGLASGGRDVLGGGGAIDNGFANFMQGTLLDFAPDRYQADASHLVEGLERSLRGELTAEETDEYIADFGRLERRASGDCAPYEGQTPDFGGGGGGFGFGSD
jgi:hypothetical protein